MPRCCPRLRCSTHTCIADYAAARAAGDREVVAQRGGRHGQEHHRRARTGSAGGGGWRRAARSFTARRSQLHGSGHAVHRSRRGARRAASPLISHSFDTSGGVDFGLCACRRTLIRRRRGPFTAGTSARCHASSASGADRFQPTRRGTMDIQRRRRRSSAPSAGRSNFRLLGGGEWYRQRLRRHDCREHVLRRLRREAAWRGRRQGAALLPRVDAHRARACSGAKEAVELMGRLAVEHGFAGNRTSSAARRRA